MAERTLLWKFGVNFGGLESYIICSRMVVVVVILVEICKISNLV
jgi:hypothetical protein